MRVGLVLAFALLLPGGLLADPGEEPLGSGSIEDETVAEDEEEEGRADEERRRRKVSQSCRRFTRQIAHFEDVVTLARQRDDDLWEEHTRRHIDRLKARRDRRCPPPEDRTAEVMAEFIKAAGKAALKFFTMGLL